MEPEIHRQYQAIRRGIPESTPITVLHIGEQATAVATGTAVEPEKVLMLALGSNKTATEFYLHTPPTPGEMEIAIMQVEDEVTRAREMIAGYSTLFTMDESIREIAHVASGHAGSSLQLHIDSVEQIFSILVSHTSGRTVIRSDIPGSTAFATTLLILREFMHHMKFSSISITA
jgi:exopolyphosphatase/pppGpp-phosphohydrolase